MPKAHGPPALNLSAAKSGDDGLQTIGSSPLSPLSPRSPMSAPGSPYLPNANIGPSIMANGPSTEPEQRGINIPLSPTTTAIPQYPPSPASSSPKHGRDPSKSFFSNLMASKSSHRLQSPDRNGIESAERGKTKGRASSKDRTTHSLKPRGSTPDFSKAARVQEGSAESPHERHGSEPPAGSVVETGSNSAVANKRTRPRFAGLLNRTKSIKVDDGSILKVSLTDQPAPDSLDRDPQYGIPLRSAPPRPDQRDRAFRDVIGSSVRNRSADRPPAQSQDNQTLSVRKDRAGPAAAPNSFKEGTGSHLLSNIHHTGKGVSDRLGRAGKGFLGKITRSGSSNERELVTDDNYTCTTINLPLVQQTRRTRIARRLELSRDKTEFWMPALPWRCIDYLNMNGCEEEGLYRIPGSGKDVKHWQRRFDTEHDINLFDEPDLYDINTIGSMFKSWLRELPDEILPKSVQHKIAERCAGATQTPQLLKDELSMLPPFNYYLLFAITCHLSLLHSFADKNKMDYRNLCICFQPCLKIDGFCFQFLVQDWKSCWQGCWTEKEYLEEEYRFEREGSVIAQDALAVEDRAISSSGSSMHQPATSTPAPAPAPVHQETPPIEHPSISQTKSVTNGDTGSKAPKSSSKAPVELSKPVEIAPSLNTMLPDLRPLSVLKM